MREVIGVFNSGNFQRICDELGGNDPALKNILDMHQYPPMWSRVNSYETLVHIILEQQVSLASALAALKKLKEHVTIITPDKILRLTDEDIRACYISRQKAVYIRGLAHAIKDGLSLEIMRELPDEAVREMLTALKGIGNWTVDIYLIFALQRRDIFPSGDLAAVNALKRIKDLPKDTGKETVVAIAEMWKPNRSIATMILWHYYLSSARKRII